MRSFNCRHDIQILSDKNTKDTNRIDLFVEFEMEVTLAVTNAYDTQNNDAENKKNKRSFRFERGGFSRLPILLLVFDYAYVHCTPGETCSICVG